MFRQPLYRMAIDLKNAKDRGDLILQPEFQRNFLWDLIKQSRLIETILLDYPMNPIHVTQQEDSDEMEVIDGQQRLTAIFRYMENKYALKGLKILSDLNGKSFNELDVVQRKAITNYGVGLFPYSGSTRQKYEIFERLNISSIPLNAQELRNAIFSGSMNNMLKALATSLKTKDLLQMDSIRMKDVELVLGFFAIQKIDLQNDDYRIMRTILDNYMEENRHIRSFEEESLKDEWYRFTDLCLALFDKPFRRMRNSHHIFNESIFYGCAWAIPKFKYPDLFNNVNYLKHELERLIYCNLEFAEAINSNTYSSTRIKRAGLLIHNKIKEVLDDARNETTVLGQATE